jgi:hypothetical protein
VNIVISSVEDLDTTLDLYSIDMDPDLEGQKRPPKKLEKSVVDPDTDPNPVGSETFSRSGKNQYGSGSWQFQIRNEFEISLF